MAAGRGVLRPCGRRIEERRADLPPAMRLLPRQGRRGLGRVSQGTRGRSIDGAAGSTGREDDAGRRSRHLRGRGRPARLGIHLQYVLFEDGSGQEQAASDRAFEVDRPPVPQLGDRPRRQLSRRRDLGRQGPWAPGRILQEQAAQRSRSSDCPARPRSEIRLRRERPRARQVRRQRVLDHLERGGPGPRDWQLRVRRQDRPLDPALGQRHPECLDRRLGQVGQ